MNGKRNMLLFISVWLVTLNGAGLAMAQSEVDEVRVQTMQREAEEDAVKRGQKVHAELLAKQFQIPVSDIEKMRTAGQG